MNSHCAEVLKLLVMVVISILLMDQNAYSANTKPFCAIPLSTVLASPSMKTELETVGEKGNHHTGPLWPTKTIPVVVDPSFPAAKAKAFKDAVKDVQTKTGFTFLKCSPDTVANDPAILGYANLMSNIAAHCKDDGGACVWGTYFDKTKNHIKGQTTDLLKRGSSIGIGDHNAVVITHELLHLLGLGHTHKSLEVREYLNVGNPTHSDCSLSVTGGYSKVYDPASIMHYGLPGDKCRIALRGCKLSAAPDKDGFRKISGCPLENYLKTALICAYAGPGGKPIFGNACFRLPKRQSKFGVPVHYEEFDFKANGGECISIVDQSLIYWLYKHVTDDDLFKIKGKCTTF